MNKILILIIGLSFTSAKAELTPLKIPVLNGNKYVGSSVIEDSIDNTQKPFRDRIYYYDLALDSSGRAFVLYAKPKPVTPNVNTPVDFKNEKTDIILAIENGDSWDKQILTTEGIYQPTGIQIDVDSQDVMHLIYIRQMVKEIAGKPELVDYLIYRKRTPAGVLSEEIEVGDLETGNLSGLGGWRTRLEITSDDKIYMIREGEAEFRILIPENGNWRQESITGLSMNWPRLGEFKIDAKGRPHIIYGDYAYDANGNSYNTNSEFSQVDHNGYHNLWYAFSETLTGSDWKAKILSENPYKLTPTLYNFQFWVDLTIDKNNNPAVAKWIWKPGTISPQAYNTYTVFFHKKSSNWDDWQIARTTASFDNLTYKGQTKDAGTVAGMGPGIIQDKYGWHGIWDNSHPRPFEHVSDRGGIMYRFSPDGIKWTVYQRIAPFSAEGRCEVQIHNGNLNILILGDHTDTQLYLLRYKLPDNPLMEVFPDRETYYQGESISLHALIRDGFVGNWYLAAKSRGNPAIAEPGDIWYMKSDFTWAQISSLNQAKPVFVNTQGFSFNDKIAEIPPLTPPFNKAHEYDIYSLVTKPGTTPFEGQWLTPLFHKHIFANWPLP